MGRLLKACGLKVTAVKIDPYLNCDAGTMNPYQHGEVFVLDDGSEVDLDLGNYERFLDISLTTDHNITTGKVYRTVIEKERKGDYLGKTVQIIPHITNEIKDRIKSVAEKDNADVAVVELGGTVGDIESAPFLEAVRQLYREVGGKENCVFVHTTLVPVMGVVGEQKTKPTQHSVKELRAIGIHPDLIIGRASHPLDYDIKRKIALFCDVPLEAVISAPDAKSIYQVPMLLDDQGITDYLIRRLGYEGREKDLGEWEKFVRKILHPNRSVEIGIVGKYTDLADSYISHKEALTHSGAELATKINIRWVEAEELEKRRASLKGVDAVVIPGGFGKRGFEGKMLAAKYARTKKIPFLGICLGFQAATVEFARNVVGLEGANSSEFEPKTRHPVVDLLPEQKKIKDMGATMRLGSHVVKLDKGSIASELYGSTKVYERHRHRYEVNPKYIARIEKAGLKYTGRSKDGVRMEVAELEGHPYYVASQFHPEFMSRPGSPAPLYLGLVKAALARKK